MGCNCMSLAQVNMAASYIRCLRIALGVSAVPKWDEEAHVALYALAARQVEVLSERRLGPEAIRAIPFGSEPGTTANYAMRAGDWLLADNGFWACLGISKAEADAGRANGSGAYWELLASVGSAVGGSEGGSDDKSGWPWWAWLLVLAAGGGAVYWLAKR